MQAAGASTDVVVQAAGPSVIGLVADKAACSAAVADAQNQHDIGGGEAARARRAQFLDVAVQAAGARTDVGVQAAGARTDVGVQTAGASADEDLPAAWDRVADLVADVATRSAAGSDADKQDDAWGGAAAWPCRAQCLVEDVYAAGAGGGAAVPAAAASVDEDVQAAGAGVDDDLLRAGAIVDEDVQAAGGRVVGLVADGSACSAAGAAAHDEDDA